MSTGAVPLVPNNGKLSPQVQEAIEEARERWLKTTEVTDIIANYEQYGFPVSTEAPVQPPGGTIYLFDRRQVRFFRKDGHNWRKKPDGKTVRETHEKLKVENQDVLNCYYAHAEEQEDNCQLQRRCYWLLEGDSNLVLVHYLNVHAESLRSNRPEYQGISEYVDDDETGINRMHVRDMAGALPQYTASDGALGWHNTGGSGNMHLPYHARGHENPVHYTGTESFHSWGSSMGDAASNVNRLDGHNSWQAHSPSFLNTDRGPMPGNASAQGSFICAYPSGAGTMQGSHDWQPQSHAHQYNFLPHQGRQYPGSMLSPSSEPVPSGMAHSYHDSPSITLNSNYSSMYVAPGPVGQNTAPPGNRGWHASAGDPQGVSLTVASNRRTQYNFWHQPQGTSAIAQSHARSLGVVGMNPLGLPDNNTASRLASLPSQQHAVHQQQAQLGSDPMQFKDPSVNNYSSSNDLDNITENALASIDLRQSPNQAENLASGCGSWFNIIDYSPDWDYTTGGSKILITGSWEDLHENTALFVMFDSVEVPAVRLQPGVLRCLAPAHAPGRVSLSVTVGNKKPCSTAVNFHYQFPVHDPPGNLITSITTETSKRDLQVRLVSRLLKQTGGSLTGEDGESAAEVGKGEHSNLVDAAMARVSNLDAQSAERVLLLLLERELKIFTQQVIEKHASGEVMSVNPINEVDEDGMGLIHIVAALGYDWAVELLLHSNADVSLRDPWGLTPIHWAAAKGHEDTIAVLLRYGAECNCASYPLGSVGGFTPADLASMHNHNGIAAYLSESHLAQRLSRLRVSDDRGSSVRKRNRNIPVNIPVGLSHSNDDSAEQEVHIISTAAREAAEKIYKASDCGQILEMMIQQNSRTSTDTSVVPRQSQQDFIDMPSTRDSIQDRHPKDPVHIATEAPELDLAVNRVQAIVHNVFAREQYMRMREAAERQQVSIVSGLCKYENDDSGPNSHGLV